VTDPTARTRGSSAPDDEVRLAVGGAPSVRLLGPLSVEYDGRQASLGGPRQRSVLALLALEPNQVVPVEALIDRLWAGDPPASAANTLQSYVSHLRRALVGSGFEIRTQSRGYALSGDEDAIDVVRFERLLRDAGAAMDDGDTDKAVATVRAALTLWRGPALADFLYDEFAHAEASRLEDQRLDALGLLFDAQIARGQGHTVVAELEVLVGKHPLRESFRAQLMRALAGSGRRAEALRVYQQGREVFEDELGLDPSSALQDLERAILNDELPVVAYAVGEPARRGLAEPSSPVGAQLPLYITSFVGRQDELDTCAGLLERYRLVTVTGPGGIGKTRLAIELARRLRPDFADGVFVFELAALADPELVALAVANGIGAAVQPDRPASDTLVMAVGDRHCLLVFDNCEHVLDTSARLVGSLLRACPNIRVMATSRERLGMSGEAVWPLPPLRVPAGGDGDRVEDILDCDAVRLFVERGEAAWPGFVAGPANALVLAEICRELDGIPLAVELAAARLTSLSVEEVRDRLGNRFELLRGTDRTALPRQQTLRGAIEWSYDLLDERERALFRRLGVFSGTFDLSAVVAVCPNAEMTSAVMGDVLAALVEKSLVERTGPVGGESRYRMLESVRQFSEERLAAAGEERPFRRSHALAFTARAGEGAAGLHGPATVGWVARLDSDEDNFRAALEWLLNEGDADGALMLTGQLWLYWRYKDQPSDGIDCLRRALARGGSAPRRLNALVGLARLAMLANEPSAVEEACDAGIGLLGRFDAADRDARVAEAHFLAVRAEMLRHVHKETARAEELVGRAAAAFRDLGEPYWQAHAHRVWAQVFWDRGDLPAAERLVQEALELWRQCGDAEGVAGAQMMLAGMARQRWDEDAAFSLYEQSLEGFRAIGQRWGLAEAAVNFGTLLLARGETDRAGLLAGEALRLFDELAIGRGIGLASDVLARVEHERGDLGAADMFCSAALERLRSDGYGPDVVAVSVTAAHVALHLGDLDRAELLLAEATGPLQGFSHRKARSAALSLLARVRARSHDPSAADVALEALEAARSEGDRRSEAGALEAVAEAQCAAGALSDSVQSLRDAIEVRRAARLVMSRVERVDLDVVLDALADAAGPDQPGAVLDIRPAARRAGSAVLGWDGVERRNAERRSGERRAREGAPPPGEDDRRHGDRRRSVRRRLDVLALPV
jgi:predicted ATPase/DNA-binding SARP family transcriptional activator